MTAKRIEDMTQGEVIEAGVMEVAEQLGTGKSVADLVRLAMRLAFRYKDAVRAKEETFHFAGGLCDPLIAAN